ncbi:MAG: hypothetical protein CBD68_02635 [Flavobacteriaceae bacterium TMED208]|nr:MAG: hypothetical protein CBD68_02635 [Flavobacteriaceae bacterium TMED208]
MIRRRKALKNIGLITGGVLTLPYNCSFETQISYSNFPLLKKKEQDLIADICNIILPTDFNNFPTVETRKHFVLTMINDCLDNENRIEFSAGLNSFQNEILEVKKIHFQDLSLDEQNNIVANFIDNEKSEIGVFLNYLKHYSLIHFETSENYMINYLNFEFMPGHYNGRVKVKVNI